MEITRKERSYFKIAKAVSETSNHRQKLGCVIVDKHRIISSASNSDTKCHPIQAELDSKHFNCICAGKVHAETHAIIPLLKSRMNLSRATLYVYRQHRDGSLAMARPCSRCMELIKTVGISKIKYTTDAGYAAEFLEV